jgi:hypothetical protein
MIGKSKELTEIEILAFLWENNLVIDDSFLPPEFFEKFQDVLQLCKFIAIGWAKPTKDSQELINYIWNVLCEMRDLNPKDKYKDIMEFFNLQEAKVDF